jgi:hypothetical protein
MSWDAEFSRYMSLSNGITYFSAVIFVTTILSVVRCTHGRSWQWSNDEYCDMFLTLGTCSSRAGTAALEYVLLCPGWRHPDANVFPRLEQRSRETGTVSPTEHLNMRRPRTLRAPAGTVTAAVEWEPWRNTWYRTRFGAIPTEGPRNTSWP